MVDYPLGGDLNGGTGTSESTSNNLFVGYGEPSSAEDNTPNVNSEAGVKALSAALNFDLFRNLLVDRRARPQPWLGRRRVAFFRRKMLVLVRPSASSSE